VTSELVLLGDEQSCNTVSKERDPVPQINNIQDRIKKLVLLREMVGEVATRGLSYYNREEGSNLVLLSHILVVSLKSITSNESIPSSIGFQFTFHRFAIHRTS
jgi:hypothetical protein